MTLIANSYCNKLNRIKHQPNYWSPLTNLVEELEDEPTADVPKAVEKNESEKNEIHKKKRRAVGFDMANTVSKMEDEMNQMLAEFEQINNAIDGLLTESEATAGADEDEIPNGIFDTGATSGVATEADAVHMRSTDRKSSKIFMMPNGQTMPATNKMTLAHNLRHPATEMNVVPGVHTTLLSGSKFADAGYKILLDKDGLHIYDGKTTTIKISNEAVLRGYRCKSSGLWRIPLKDVVHNENTDTLLVQRPPPGEAIAHVFELPSTEKTVRYYHAAAGFPTYETWLAAVQAGNYDTWPGLTAKAV